MSLSKRDKRAIVLGSAGLVLALAVRLVIIPWLDADSQSSQADLMAAQLDQYTSQLRRVVSLRARLAKQYGPAAEKPLKDIQEAKLVLFDSAAAILKQGGFQKPEYLPQKPKRLPDIKGVRLVSLRVSGTCRLQQLTSMLQEMANADALLIVDHLTINTIPKKQGQLKVTMVLGTLAIEGKETS